MDKISGIQIIGTQRSGSNLLRLMLNQLDEIDAPHPPHILRTFVPLLPHYGDLNEKKNFDLLVDDVCNLVEYNPVPWNLSFNREEIAAQCRSNSLLEIFRVIYAHKAESEKATHWCCKSMANVHFAAEMEQSVMQPFYIHLYRDGRDVALSFQKAIVGQKHMYHLALQWKNDQEQALNWCKNIPEERYIALSYEDMLQQPEACIQRICDKLGVPFTDKVRDYYRSEDSMVTAASGRMWQNVAQPIMSGNFNKYKTNASPEDIHLFESIAGDTLTSLGYDLENPGIGNNGFSSEEVENFHVMNESMKLEARSKADPADLEKRKKQREFLQTLTKERSWQ
jgi:hypothetical protein